MPYDLSLQAYTPPEFYREAPESWVTRLRDVSPVRSDVAHLVFRWFEPHVSWNWSDRGMWVLYSATPKHLVTKERAEQFRLHWSELPSGEQHGRQAVVSDYQHFMWHTQGVEVRPFWILQGQWGGTPAKYTERERRYLDASDAVSEPYPIGFFPACAFDARAVNLIAQRDRLLQAGNNLDRLAAMERPEWLKAEDEAAERLHRETYLDTWREMMRPSVEFMGSYLRKSEADHVLPRASRETANAVSQWRDHFIETGHVIGARPARTQVLV
jgi:hypothetical protein